MAVLTPHAAEKRASVQVEPAVQKAARQFVAQWPLQSFIACNPLLNFESYPFFEALSIARNTLGQEDPLPIGAFQHFLASQDLSLELLQRQLYQYCRDTDVAPWQGWLWTDLSVSLNKTVSTPDAKTVAQTHAWLCTLPSTLFESNPASASMVMMAAWIDRLTTHTLETTIDAQLIKWLGAYLDKGQALWPLPHKDQGLFQAWRQLAPLDTTLDAPVRARLAALLKEFTGSRYALIGEIIHRFNIPASDLVTYFTHHFRRLPGWVGYLRWTEEHQAHTNLMADYIAIRLCYEWAYCHDICTQELQVEPTLIALKTHARAQQRHVDSTERQIAYWAQRLATLASAQQITSVELQGLLSTSGLALMEALQAFDEPTQQRLLIEAMETGYQKTLFTQLSQTIPVQDQAASALPAPKLAHMVFCIDARSEPLRRQLETHGSIETSGFAGFFGLPVRLREFCASYTMDCCPALLSPRYSLDERATPSDARLESHYRQHRMMVDHTQVTLLQTKKNPLATFGYIETFGLLYAIAMLAKTWAPIAFNRLTRWLGQCFLPPINTQFVLSPPPDASSSHTDMASGITFEEQVFYAEMILTLMGLTRDFSPFVIFCGHGTQTLNNPYASALDCGACGGNHGGPNARILATMLNDPTVREALAGRNIMIPAETIFLAAEHNTVTDEIRVFEQIHLSPEQQQQLQPILDHLHVATRQNSHQRRRALDGYRVHNSHQAAVDWSQVRPEWGLARNAAFIAAPRALTQSINLEGRAFLHSYDWTQDNEGMVLETIMTAPLIVAEWINTQYLMSTLDNGRYGSGTKVLHNVAGQHGVMLGNASDLQMGLPLQSVMRSAHEPYHVPLRLTTVIQAPYEHIQRILDRQGHVKDLCDNQWIHLYALDPDMNLIRRYQRQGQWHLLN